MSENGYMKCLILTTCVKICKDVDSLKSVLADF